MVSRKLFYMKFVFSFILFFFIIMLIVAIPIYSAADHTVKKQLGNKCKGIAISVAALIEEDIEEYAHFIATLNQNSEYYKKTKTILENIKFGNRDNIAYLYTEIRVSNAEMMYVLDSELENTGSFTPPGMREPLTRTRLLAYETKEVAVGDFVTTQWGTLLSAYAPIYNKKSGEFVGLVGADVSIDQYNEIMKYQLAIIVGSIAILLLMIMIVFFISSGWVEKMLVTDKLTGVFNRRFFERELTARVKLAGKNGELFVFMADLDDFKQINDTYGHLFGDKVLENIAKTMSSVLRKTDFFARYGGEEFAGCLSGLNETEALVIMDRMREAAESARIYNNEHDKYIFITVSIGLARHRAGQSGMQVIKNADNSLYNAKTTKNTIKMFAEN